MAPYGPHRAGNGGTVIFGLQNSREWARFCADVTTDLAPVGALERALVARLAGLLWRLQRVPWIEAALLRVHVHDNRRQRMWQALLSPRTYSNVSSRR